MRRRTIVGLWHLTVLAGSLAAAADPLAHSAPAIFSLLPNQSRTFEIDVPPGTYIRIAAESPEAILTCTLHNGATRVAQVTSIGGTGGVAVLGTTSNESGAPLQLAVLRTDKKPSPAEIKVEWLDERAASSRDVAEAKIYRNWPDAKTAAALMALRVESAAVDNAMLTLALAIAEARALFAAGEYQAGLDLIRSELPLARKTPQAVRVEAMLLYLAGLCQIQMEKPAESAASFEQALGIQRQLIQPFETSATVHNLSAAHFTMGRCQEALGEAEEALQIRRGLTEPAREATSMLAVAKAHGCLGNAQQALDGHHELLPIWRKLKDSRNEAVSLNDMGMLYTALGDWQQAKDSLAASLRVREALGDIGGQGETLVNRGNLHLLTADYKAALADYEKALHLPAEGEYQRRVGYAIEGKGEALFRLGRKEEAVPLLKEGLAKLEQVGDRGAQAFTWRMLAEAGGSTADYRRAIAIAHEVGDRLSEAVSLADLARLEFSRKELPLAREDAERAVGIIETSRASLADPRLRMDYLSASRNVYELSVEALTRMDSKGNNQFQAFTMSERAHSRTLLDAIGSAPDGGAAIADLAAIRAEALDDQTVLAEYFLGADRSWLWFLSRDSFLRFELPRRDVLEGLARRYYTSLTARNVHNPGESPEERTARLKRADETASETASELSRLLLGPIRTRIGDRRLLVADDGLLRLAPFAALGLKGEVVLIPSASFLVQLRRAAGSRDSAGRMLILADPVFGISDPRLLSKTQSVASLATAASGATGAFPRLVQTRTEADSIARLHPAKQVEERLDFDASAAVLRGAGASRYGAIHIATHTIVDSGRPDRSGIVLSLVDRQGKPQAGVLGLREIYNMHLRTGLITLSACETAIGKQIGGEGMVGLSHAFLFAGAQRVVASLWKVEDSATAKLMQHFYAGIYERKLSPAAALHAAQMALRADARWQAPYYWAAFVLEGNWR